MLKTKSPLQQTVLTFGQGSKLLMKDNISGPTQFCSIGLQQLFEAMIRNNKLSKPKQHRFNATAIHTYNYRNALYQGEISKDQGQREGKGIIYVTDNHHFIVCNSFKNNAVNSHSLFYHSHSKYHYGEWLNNLPQGVSVFRMNEVLIVAQYSSGILQPHSRVLLVFEQYNTGVILEILESNQFEIIQKYQVLCSQHLEELIRKCNFSKEVVPNLLIKYLNNHMVSDEKPFIKLRLINNVYYRFGYDQGLAIIFDDSHKIVSVGVHNKSELSSFGAKYNNQKLGNKVEEGIFDGRSTVVFDQPNRPIHRIGQLYCKSHLSSVNFKNQVYKDPSEPFFAYFQDLLQSEPIIELFTSLLHNPADYVSFQKIMQQDPAKVESVKKYEKLDFPENEISSFKRPQTCQDIKYEEQMKNIQASNVIWQNSHRSVETFQFQRLSEKNRLDILRKQLYINLSNKNIKQDERQKRSRIINMSPVDIRNVEKSRKVQFKTEGPAKPNDVYIYKPQNFTRQRFESNLDKHIDIIINDFTEKENRKESKSISKSRKKIFEQCPNVIKDYSPQASPSPSPFKTKIRSKIFNRTPDRNQKSRSRSSRRIFGNSTPQKLDLTKINRTSYNQPLSPHLMYEASQEKSETSSNVKAYPITMSHEGKSREANGMTEGMKQNEKKVTEEGRGKNIKINDYLASQSNQDRKTLNEDIRRKSNTVYKNNIKGEYGDYVFQPIDIKQTGNMPYTKSNQTLSNKTLEREVSKKSIEESNPFKRDKMSAYMNNTPEGFRGGERLSDFKRRVNYF